MLKNLLRIFVQKRVPERDSELSSAQSTNLWVSSQKIRLSPGNGRHQAATIASSLCRKDQRELLCKHYCGRGDKQYRPRCTKQCIQHKLNRDNSFQYQYPQESQRWVSACEIITCQSGLSIRCRRRQRRQRRGWDLP